MSGAEKLTLKGMQVGLVLSMALTGMLFAFSCIGADAGISELVASITVGVVPLAISVALYALAVVVRVVLDRR